MFRPLVTIIFMLFISVLGQETDPNGINQVFYHLEKYPELINSIKINEDQRIIRNEEGCWQYDYVYFEWININIQNPFPDLVNGNEYCSVVKCDDVFGPAESVDCSQYF